MKTVITFDNEAEAQEFAELLGDIDQLDLQHWLAEPQIVAVAPVYLIRHREPLWFMKWARHHCRGGRSRAGRFMDRRGYVDWPELQSPDSDICSDAWANLGPFRRSIYPRRVNDCYPENGCRWCGAPLEGKRADATFCSQKCQKRFVRDKASRSLNMRREEVKSVELREPIDQAYAKRIEASASKKLDLRRRAYRNWCPKCRAYVPEGHGQPCDG